jgi:hypothetical protein
MIIKALAILSCMILKVIADNYESIDQLHGVDEKSQYRGIWNCKGIINNLTYLYEQIFLSKILVFVIIFIIGEFLFNFLLGLHISGTLKY